MKASSRPYHHGNLRQALLHAAESALATRRAGSLSLRELSREVGVSHTSPRRHFPGKQALLDALAQDGFVRLDSVLSHAAARRGGSFAARLIRVAQAYVGFALQHPTLWELMFEAKHRPGAPRDLLAASDAAFSHLPSLLKKGQLDREIIPGDPVRLSLALSAALQGLVTISIDGKFKGHPLSSLVPQVVKQNLLGLRPRNASK